jgi:ABC-2 type transport system permease protein
MTDTQPRLGGQAADALRSDSEVSENTGAMRTGVAGIDRNEEEELVVRARRAAARGPKSTRIVAARVPLRQRLRDLASRPSRELFVYLVRKEIKVKYKNSFLGFVWSMLNPALTLAVFYVLFTYFLPNGIPNFVIYMFSATLVWNLFLTGVMGATSTVVANGGIVKKVAFPREILPLASVGSAFMFFLFQGIVMVAFMFAFWHRPAWGLIWLLVPAMAGVLMFSSALAVFLSAVNVYLRDTQHLVEVLLMAWFWAVPAVYRFPQTVHDKLEAHRIFGIPGTHLLWLYFANPVTPLVMTFQRFFYAVQVPNETIAPHPPIEVLPVSYTPMWYLTADLVVIGVSLIMFLVAMVVFGRLEGNFAEEL